MRPLLFFFCSGIRTTLRFEFFILCCIGSKHCRKLGEGFSGNYSLKTKPYLNDIFPSTLNGV